MLRASYGVKRTAIDDETWTAYWTTYWNWKYGQPLPAAYGFGEYVLENAADGSVENLAKEIGLVVNDIDAIVQKLNSDGVVLDIHCANVPYV